MPFVIFILIFIFVSTDVNSGVEYSRTAHQEEITANWSGWMVRQNIQERAVRIADDGSTVTELREMWTCLQPLEKDTHTTKLVYSPIPDLAVFETVEITINEMDIYKKMQQNGNRQHAYIQDDADGRKIIILTNLKSGDRVQVRLQLSQKPLIPDHFFSTIVLSKPYLLERSIYRVTLPDHLPLFYKMTGNDQKPTVIRHANYRTYYWDVRKDLSPEQLSFPISNIDDVPRIVVSSTQDWEVIRGWFAEKFFSTRARLPLGTEAAFPAFKATEIDHNNIVQTLISISESIRPVTNHRHLGGLIPANPVDVWQKKEGDCKDIVNLLCFLLQKSNVDAWPVLVSPLNLDRALPNPYIFTHAILKVVTPKGDILFDPQKKSSLTLGTTRKNELMELYHISNDNRSVRRAQ